MGSWPPKSAEFTKNTDYYFLKNIKSAPFGWILSMAGSWIVAEEAFGKVAEAEWAGPDRKKGGSGVQ